MDERKRELTKEEQIILEKLRQPYTSWMNAEQMKQNALNAFANAPENQRQYVASYYGEQAEWLAHQGQDSTSMVDIIALMKGWKIYIYHQNEQNGELQVCHITAGNGEEHHMLFTNAGVLQENEPLDKKAWDSRAKNHFIRLEPQPIKQPEAVEKIEIVIHPAPAVAPIPQPDAPKAPIPKADIRLRKSASAVEMASKSVPEGRENA